MEINVLIYIFGVGVPVFATIVGFAIKSIVETKEKTKLIDSINVGDILCRSKDSGNPFLETEFERCRKICDIREDNDGFMWFDYIECDKEGYSTYQTHWQMNEKSHFFEDCVKLNN